MDSDFDYESIPEREARMQREIEKRRKKGEPFEPVVCEVARGLPAASFWGKAWCEHLESFVDYEARLPRGRTYLRKGYVHDLEINAGNVFAYVVGRHIYEVEISVVTLAHAKWDDLKTRVSGEVGNLVALLSGKLGDGVMQAVTDRETGLFPSPKQISFNCSCPDWANMCKHVAATMYAVGVKLDQHPELLFKLRKVDHTELLDAASADTNLSSGDTSAEVLQPNELADLFGIDLAEPESAFH